MPIVPAPISYMFRDSGETQLSREDVMRMLDILGVPGKGTGMPDLPILGAELVVIMEKPETGLE